MITRMEMTYRSKEPCNVKPKIFTTGGYEIVKDSSTFHFDFEDMEASVDIENGYLHISCLQKNLDPSLLEGFQDAEVDRILQTAKKEDFSDIFYECFADDAETKPIELIPESIVFYDFSTTGTGEPIVVGGESFSGLEKEMPREYAIANHKKIFAVTITETSKMTVEIEAEDICEAEEIAEENWNNSEYVIGSENFVGADFEATPVSRECTALPSRKAVEKIKAQYAKGMRIELISMSGENHMPTGLKGVVTKVDDAGQIHMSWYNGSTLALVVGEDTFQIIQ